MIVTCDTCGKQFDRKPSKVKTHNYCCRKCVGVANGIRSKKTHRMVCDYCGKEFIQKNRHAARNRHFYCSQECGWADKVRKETVACEWCGVSFEKKQSDIARSNHNLCSWGCYRDFINFEQAGAKNQRVSGQVLYRTLLEMRIGRKLKSDEEAHHIDGNHFNNSEGNLVIVTKSEHASIHAAMKKRDEYGRFVKEV